MDKHKYPARIRNATSILIMGDNPSPKQIRHVVKASKVWSMKKPYTGLCVRRTRANVPSRLSPYQLMTNPNEANHRNFVSIWANIPPTAKSTAPITPMKVRKSDVTHAGCLCASHISNFFSILFKMEVWILSDDSFPIFSVLLFPFSLLPSGLHVNVFF